MTAVKTLLLVDDEDRLRVALARLLSLDGYAVEHANGNPQALASLRRSRPDVVLTDLNHVGGTGLELLEAIRADATTADVPVVIFTGRPTAEAMSTAFQLGISAFLTKPASGEDILRAIGNALGGVQQDPVVALIEHGEGRDIDFKEEVVLSDKRQRAELARDMIAMANSGGGSIVIGVAEVDGRPVPKGVSDERLADLEITRIGNAVKDYVPWGLRFRPRRVTHDQYTFVVIRVSPFGASVALAMRSHEKAGLFTGRIYIRTHDARTTELTDAAQLHELLDAVIEARRRSALSLDLPMPALTDPGGP